MGSMNFFGEREEMKNEISNVRKTANFVVAIGIGRGLEVRLKWEIHYLLIT